jgi:hypothetical protein
MPWTIGDVDRFKAGLSREEKRRWVEVANSALRRCLDNGGSQDDCEARAIRQANGITGNTMQIHEYAAHLDGQIRRERLEGHDYLVAPVVAVREGVLNGFYVPGEEIAAFVDAWNGRPLPVYHPRDPQTGEHVTANTPERLTRYNIGHFFNAHYDESDKALKGEIWVNTHKARQVEQGQEVLRRLENNQPLDVSTAFWSQDEYRSGELHGQTYQGIRRYLRPDHLALLPNARGACSWEDGCGAPRTHEEQDQGLVRKLLNALGIQGGGEVGTNDCGCGPSANVSTRKVERRLESAVKAEGNPNRNVSVLDIDPDEGTFIYRADQFGGDIEEDPWRYFRRGYSTTESGGVTLGAEMEEVRPVTEYEVVSQDGAGEAPATNQQGANAMTKDQKVAAIVAHTGNSFTEADTETLKGQEDAFLDKLVPNAEGEGGEPSAGQDGPAGNGEPASQDGQGAPAAHGSEPDFSEVKDPSLRAHLERLHRQEQEKRQGLIDRLSANDACKVSANGLKAMETQDLEALEESLKPADYSGRGGVRTPSANSEEDAIPAPPPAVLAAPETKQ